MKYDHINQDQRKTNLVELEDIEQVKEFAIFFAVFQLAVILLQAVQSQLCLIIHKHLHRLQTHTELHVIKQANNPERAVHIHTDISLLNTLPPL